MNFKGLSQDEGRAEFAKKNSAPLPLIKASRID